MKRVPLIHIIIATGHSGFSPFVRERRSLVSYADLACIVVRRISYSTSYYNRVIDRYFYDCRYPFGKRSRTYLGRRPFAGSSDEMKSLILLWQHWPVYCGMLWQHSRYSACSIFSSSQAIGIMQMEYPRRVGVMMDMSFC